MHSVELATVSVKACDLDHLELLPQCDPNHRNPDWRVRWLQLRLHMNWLRKGLFMVMAAAICWSGLPEYDCLFTAQPTADSDCCRAMAANCPMPDAGMNSNCCSTQPQKTAVTQDSSYSPEHPQKIFLTSHSVSFVAPAASRSIDRTPVEAPPPRLTTGRNSILRI